jgi:allantoin racemase
VRLNLINPNTSVAMTQAIAAAAARVARPGTTIRAVESELGPASIEGPYDDALAVPGLLLRIAQGEAEGVDAHVIACFDDTGLDAARALAAAPVVGIGEAAFHVASLLAHRFGVVTTLARSVPVIEQNLVRYGLDRRCTRVRAADVAVLAIAEEASNARARIAGEIEQALSQDGAEAIVLGCAGMAKLARDLAIKHACPVIEGVGAAVKLAEMLVQLGLRTSKRGGYELGAPKTLTGAIKGLA